MPKNTTASKLSREEEDQLIKRALLAMAKACEEDPQLRRAVLAHDDTPYPADQQLDRGFARLAKVCEKDCPARTMVLAFGKQHEEDRQLKRELLALAKSGAPRPKRGTRLGDALHRFTTRPDQGLSAFKILTPHRRRTPILPPKRAALQK